MAKKKTYCFPLNKATSSQILSFSAEAMADDMAATSGLVWDLLGHLLNSNKRQAQSRDLLRRRVQEFQRAKSSTASTDLEEIHDSGSESDDSDDKMDNPSAGKVDSVVTKKEINQIERLDALTRVVSILYVIECV